jgi:hypothetical protein
VTTIKQAKDGSKQISTAYKPEVPEVQAAKNYSDSMKMLIEANVSTKKKSRT